MTDQIARVASLLLLTTLSAAAQLVPTAPRTPNAPPSAATAPMPPTPPGRFSLLADGVNVDLSVRASFEETSGFTIRDGARYPQDPADSLYREARALLNRGEWRKAATHFSQIAQRQPVSRYAADALHWQAFALYRIGGTTELREALASLDARRSRFPEASSKSESDALATRISSALAARGDVAARERLARTTAGAASACDSEEISVRTSALNALMRSDPGAAQALLARVLERRDECSVPLRKNAVMLIGTRGDASAKARLADVVQNDPSAEVRGDAIGYLAKVSGDEVVATLDAVIRNGSEDEGVQRAAVRALGEHESPRARAAIRALVERSSASERLRLEALSTFDRGGGYQYAFSTTGYSSAAMAYSCSGDGCAVAPVPPVPPVAPAAPVPAVASVPSSAGAGAPRGAASSGGRMSTDGPPNAFASALRESERRLAPEDAAWLRGVYPRLETTRLKSRAASVLSRATDEATRTWLMGLILREEEPADVRATVLSRLGRDLPIAQLNRFYDAASNRAVREQIVSVLGDRKEPEATDKLIEIVRSGTDPNLRRSAISALTRKNDPRTTQLLLELIGR